jgi:hypothetical protein
MKIAWWVGADIDWAFLHLARSVESKTPDLDHVYNEQGDINIATSVFFLSALPVDKSFIARISGHRFYTNHGVTFDFSKTRAVGWWVGPTQWAFRYLAEHIQAGTPEYKHKENEAGNINIVMDPVTLMNHPADDTYIMHLDGNRFFEDREVVFDGKN